MILDSMANSGPPRGAISIECPRLTRVDTEPKTERVPRMKTATTPLNVIRSKAPALIATMTALSIVCFGIATLTQAQEPARTVATGSGIPLSADAPDRYTVKHGDTLW